MNLKESNRLNLSKVKIGIPIPDWSIEPLFGEKHVPAVSEFIGKPLLILFFSLECPGCVGRAIPYANRIVYENGMNINAIGIHTNFESLDIKQERFMAAKEELYIRFPFYRDKNYDTTFLNFGAGGTPHWILVDNSGKVVFSIFGSEPNNALLRLDLRINELLINTNVI